MRTESETGSDADLKEQKERIESRLLQVQELSTSMFEMLGKRINRIKDSEQEVTPQIEALNKFTTVTNGGALAIIFSVGSAYASAGVSISAFLEPTIFFSLGILVSGLRLFLRIEIKEDLVEAESLLKTLPKELEKAFVEIHETSNVVVAGGEDKTTDEIVDKLNRNKEKIDFFVKALLPSKPRRFFRRLLDTSAFMFLFAGIWTGFFAIDRLEIPKKSNDLPTIIVLPADTKENVRIIEPGVTPPPATRR